jgi:Bacterial type II/III secretion system short domain
LRRSVAIVTLLLAAALMWADEQAVRAFVLHHRSASQVVAVVGAMLSPQGSVVLQPRLNTLVVRDSDDVLARVGEFIHGYDVGPLTYRVVVRLLLASNVKPTPRPQGPHFSTQAEKALEAAREAAPRGPHFYSVEDELKRFFPFKFFTPIDTLNIDATEGTEVEALAAGEYLVRFMLQSLPRSPQRIQLSELELQRGVRKAGATDRQRVLRTTVNLLVGQTSVIGAARSEHADEALVLVLTATRGAPR